MTATEVIAPSRRVNPPYDNTFRERLTAAIQDGIVRELPGDEGLHAEEVRDALVHVLALALVVIERDDPECLQDTCKAIPKILRAYVANLRERVSALFAAPR